MRPRPTSCDERPSCARPPRPGARTLCGWSHCDVRQLAVALSCQCSNRHWRAPPAALRMMPLQPSPSTTRSPLDVNGMLLVYLVLGRTGLFGLRGVSDQVVVDLHLGGYRLLAGGLGIRGSSSAADRESLCRSSRVEVSCSASGVASQYVVVHNDRGRGTNALAAPLPESLWLESHQVWITRAVRLCRQYRRRAWTTISCLIVMAIEGC